MGVSTAYNEANDAAHDEVNDEARRLEVLRSYALLDTPPEEEFDRITRLTSALFDVPIALISLIDAERQWFKSKVGISLSQTPRSESFCHYAIKSDSVMVVEDATHDPRLCELPAVTSESGVRFYAGAPLCVPSGVCVGTLCIADTKPRSFSPAQQQHLYELAQIVVDAIQLRQSERRFRTLVEDGYDFLVIFDEQGCVTYVSPSVERQLGYKSTDLLGRPMFDLVHPDDRERVGAHFKGLIENSAILDRHSFRIAHKDGSYHLLEAVGRNCLNDPNIGGIVATARDVTDRVEAEAQLRDSESRFQTAFEQSALGVALVDLDGRWLRVNEALLTILGYSEEELLSIDFQSITHPSDLDADLELVEQLLHGKIPTYTMEKRYRHREGHWIWAQLWVALVRENGQHNGAPRYFIAQVQDISERKTQEEELHLLKSVAVHAREAVIITTPATNDVGPTLLYVNPAFTQITGYTADEVFGRHPTFLYGRRTDESFIEQMRAALQSGQDVDGELVLYRKDGTTFWADFDVVAVRNGENITHWVCHMRDVTERHKAREALEIAKEEAEYAREAAERANVAKSEFLSRMSHELRTPLNAILGFGQLLEIAPLASSDHQSVEQIMKAGRHLLELINEVLDISRIESGRLALSLEPVLLGQVAREAFDLVRSFAAQANVSLINEGVLESPLMVKADRTRLKQVLINLLTNAVKYNHAGGHVVLSVCAMPENTGSAADPNWCDSSDGNAASVYPLCASKPVSTGAQRLRICVSDTGRGIPREKWERVFVPFERLGAEKEDVEGTGIGLTLSRRLAIAMEGTLDFTSVPGQGSTFWLELPLAAPVEALANSPDSSIHTTTIDSNDRHLIIYIEDNLSNLQLMQGVLSQRPGVRMLTASDPFTGLDLVRSHPPDLLLLDLHLPEMSGEEVLRRLRADPKTRDVPVFIITADATPKQKARLVEAGVQVYLVKPFQINSFLTLLDQHLQKPASTSNVSAFDL